jgi:hypothetical protein
MDITTAQHNIGDVDPFFRPLFPAAVPRIHTCQSIRSTRLDYQSWSFSDFYITDRPTDIRFE